MTPTPTPTPTPIPTPTRTLKPNESDSSARRAVRHLSVVAPVYNEVEIIETFVLEVRDALQKQSLLRSYEILLVNDGSFDGTSELLDSLVARFPQELRVVHLARNFGHSAAVYAGLCHATGDVVILMDSDMQDDPAAFGAFLDKWAAGYDVVYAVRSERQEPRLLRVLFWMFYRLADWISDIELPRDAGNYSLMDARVVQLLNSMGERSRYLPGMRAWVGFRQVGVPVARRKRHDNRTRVGMSGLWRLAANAVFSFSYLPLRIFRVVGAVSIMASLGIILFALYHKIFTGLAIKAWASQLISISFFGGINLVGLGVMGEYIARIYDEVKARPTYVVDRVTSREKVTEPSEEVLSVR